MCCSVAIIHADFFARIYICRLTRNHERLSEILVGLHLLTYAILMLKRFLTVVAQYA